MAKPLSLSVVLFACALSCACSTAPRIKKAPRPAKFTESLAVSEARASANQAAFELSCAPTELASTPLGETVRIAVADAFVTRTNHAVSGCGKSASYLVECSTSTLNGNRSCSATIASAVHGAPIRAESPATHDL